MDYVTLMNLIFCILILLLGIKKWRDTGVKAFLLVGLGFTMFGISHTMTLLGYATPLKTVLIGVRSIGYILVIIGLLV